MKLSKTAVILACTMLAAMGCGKEENKRPVSAEGDAVVYHQIIADGIDYLSSEGIQAEKGLEICMVGKESGGYFWDQLEKGADQAVKDINKEMGYEGSDKIELTFDAPEKEDIIEQVNIIDQFLDKSPDAICISFTDAGACSTQMALARNNGITLYAVDSADKENSVDLSCTTDNEKAAREAAAHLYETLEDGAQVAVIVHNSLSETGMMRLEGFQKELEENYQDKNIEIVAVADMKEEGSMTEIMDQLLEDYPDLDGILCSNQNVTVDFLDYLENSELQIKAVGFDVNEKIIEAVKEGKLIGTIAQDPYGMGYASVIAVVRELSGMRNVSDIHSSYCWVDQENLETEEVQILLDF